MSIEAMKQARETLCEDRAWLESDAPERVWDANLNAMIALDEAIAEAEKQEPVAWGVDWGKAGDTPCVSIIKRMPDGRIEVVAVEYAPYTHPPKSEWAGLTDEEIEEIALELPMDAVRITEAKLKKKNGYAEEKNT